jgi:hypothetical protein
MELTHFSGEPFEFDPNYIYAPDRQAGYGKPVGFWLSDESDHGWKQWCTEADWGTERLGHRTSFRLTPGANILHLTTVDEILAFHSEYGVSPFPGADFGLIPDWDRVKEQYGGILITPYQWTIRSHLDMLWYSGWDCASGCFWDLSAIELVEQEETSLTSGGGQKGNNHATDHG